MATLSLEGPLGCSREQPLAELPTTVKRSLSEPPGSASVAQELRPLRFYVIQAHSRVRSHTRPVGTALGSLDRGSYEGSHSRTGLRDHGGPPTRGRGMGEEAGLSGLAGTA